MKVDSLNSLAAAAAHEPSPIDRWRLSGWISRGQLFAGLLILSCANGLAARAIEASRELGWQAVTAGFNVSAIVWLAVPASLGLVLRTGEEKVKASDLFIGAIVMGLTAVPVPKLSWVALTLSSIHIS